MNPLSQMEIARTLLNNAGNMNVSKEILLKLSQKMDKYIVDYYRENNSQKISIYQEPDKLQNPPVTAGSCETHTSSDPQDLDNLGAKRDEAELR